MLAPRDAFSNLVIKGLLLKVESGKVVLDEERLRQTILTPSILARILPDLSPSDREVKLTSYFNHVRFYAPPVIETQVGNSGAAKKLLMAFAYRTSDALDNIKERMKWEAIRLSFERSGVSVQTIPTQDDDAPHMLWQRDPYLMIGGKAFFPDPKMMESYLSVDRLTNHQLLMTRQDAWLQSLKRLKAIGIKTITVEGCYFEGGNLIPDVKSGFMFCGVKGAEYRRENIRLLCQDIEAHTDIRLSTVYIPTDSQNHPHLDMGCSERMPNDKFLICSELGHNMNGEGYKKLVEHLGRSRVIPYSYNLRNSMAANLSSSHDMVMLPDCDDDVYEILRSEGLIVNSPRPNHVAGTRYEFPDAAPCRVIGRGGVHCFTNELR